MRNHIRVITEYNLNQQIINTAHKCNGRYFYIKEVNTMDNFKIIYSILKILEKSMDAEEFDKSRLSNESLKLSEPRWSRIMAMLAANEYVTGIEVWHSIDCDYPRVCITRPEITLKGLEYLSENSLMKKAANIAKGIKDIPFVP